MVTREHILNITLTDVEILNIIQRALDNFDIAHRDNLRRRNINIQFDCMLRGYVGEYSIVKWLGANGIEFESTNHLNDGENIDIDFLYKNKNLELKTSLVPDVDETIDNAILQRDIKLIKREDRIEDLRGDIHMQIYFAQKRKAKDDWLTQQKIDLTNTDLTYLFNSFNARAYRNTTFFVAWIDKPTLIRMINALPVNQRTWTFPGSQRYFWICKIKNSKPPAELIPYLLALPIL